MGLTDEVVREIPYRKKAWVLERLGSEADEFLDLLADRTVGYSEIHKVLGRRGITIPIRTVYQWTREARL